MFACIFFFFFFNDTATTEIYTLSLHDALPISAHVAAERIVGLLVAEHPAAAMEIDHDRMRPWRRRPVQLVGQRAVDRKSTRLNSSHSQISYAVFCLKKKKKTMTWIARFY